MALRENWRSEQEWLDGLPGQVAELASEWGLAPEEPVDTPHSLVVPAGDVVLKINAPSHYEADHEADALASWDGRGAVRLLARDDRHRAFLLERCRPGTRLWDSGADEAAVVGQLLPRLMLDAGESHPFRHAADEARRWAEDVPARYELGGRPFERSLVELARRRLPHSRSGCDDARQPGSPRRQHPQRGAGAVARHRSEAARRRARARRGRPAAKCGLERRHAGRAALARRPRRARPRPRASAGLGRRARTRVGLD